MVTRIGPSKPKRHYLSEWREKAKLTQEQLANRIESTKATISRWESGERDITFKALCAIADAIDIDVSQLFIDPARPSADALLKNASEKTVRLVVKMVVGLVEEDKNKKDGTHS